jgi:hypothetical protein
MYGHALGRGYAVRACISGEIGRVKYWILLTAIPASFLPQNYAEELAALYRGS